ncbi:beta-galactosidase [Arcanobacterium hippocoleae]|uniref:beta-galactosidase n=1 Tax=Arcanobacterium hippocoleae TaxID=149017 RepID=UPI0033414057
MNHNHPRFTRLATLAAAGVAAVALSLSGLVGISAASATPKVSQILETPVSTVVKTNINDGKHISFPGNDGRPHKVTWDKYTFKVDDEPLHIYSGEIHYWRLPSPQQWRDVMQKMRAGGFNAISLYFFWGYHQTSPGGAYDFTGVKDLDLLMRMAAEEGLYVIARPGPYINAEISMGGLPAWLTNSGANLRSADDPAVLAQSLDWMHHVNQILKNHQVTNGTGSMLMYQSENEMFFQATPQIKFQRALTDQIRKDGITVPLFHNDWAPNGKFSGEKMRQAGLDFYAYDDYPIRFDCGAMRFELGDHESKVRRFAPDSPIFVAEGQGGAFSPWGAKFQASDCIDFADDNYIRQWGATNIGNGVTAFNYYMIFGGTNWGWTGSPHSGFTSYDYGAGITEDRDLTGKFTAQKELGYFQNAAPAFARSEPVKPSAIKAKFGSAVVKGYQRLGVDPEASVTGGGMRWLAFRHVSSNQKRTSHFATNLRLTGADGATIEFPRIPADPARYLTIHGRDAMMMTADQRLGDFELYYTTSQLFANEELAAGRFAALIGASGDYGESVFHFATEPQVDAPKGVDAVYDLATEQLRVSYTYGDIPQDIRITDADGKVLHLQVLSRDILHDKWLLSGGDGTQTLWVDGADLVRTVEFQGDTAHLTGSMNQEGKITVWLPAGISKVTFNGAAAGSADELGRVAFNAAGPAPVVAPSLQWRAQGKALRRLWILMIPTGCAPMIPKRTIRSKVPAWCKGCLGCESLRFP